MSEVATHEVPQPRTGWFRPFCLSILVLLLLNTLIVGIVIVMLVRGIISIPSSILSALTGGPATVTVQATTVLDKIQSLSQLTATRYTYSSLITSQRDMPGILATLYGDKLVLVGVGYVNAGVDLRQVTPTDITTTADTMTIKLPPAQLLDCFLDEQASYIVSRDTGIFARPAQNLDQEARRFAVHQFRDMALKADILSKAQSNAQTVVQTFVTNLGIKHVVINSTPPDPNAPLPASCQ